jgi:L-ornithine N5-monooxygenase
MSSVDLNECSLDHMYDLIGVGFGPAGIALSVAMEDERMPEDTSSWNALFLDKSKHAQWQADMLLPRTDIQHNFLRDFVTPYNPRSHYTFVNYLKEQGRLFSFGLLGVTPGRIASAGR